MQIRPFRENDSPSVIDLWQACDLTRPWNDPDAVVSLGKRLILDSERQIAPSASGAVGDSREQGAP